MKSGKMMSVTPGLRGSFSLFKRRVCVAPCLQYSSPFLQSIARRGRREKKRRG
jgi:hypothetical protein